MLRLKLKINDSKKVPLTIESVSKILPFISSFKEMYGQMFLVREGQLQQMKPWEKRHEKLIKMSFNSFLKRECLQILVEDIHGSKITGNIIKGKKHSVSSLNEIRDYIYGLKGQMNSCKIKQVRLVHTHLSQEVIDTSQEKVRLTINGLSAKDLYLKHYLSNHLECKVFVEAITPNGHYYLA